MSEGGFSSNLGTEKARRLAWFGLWYGSWPRITTLTFSNLQLFKDENINPPLG